MRRGGLRVCAMAAVLACQTPPPTTNEPAIHVVVRFTNSRLEPSIAQVIQGGTIAWSSASEYIGRVTFSAEVVERLGCSDPGPLFARSREGLRSRWIRGEIGEVVLRCPLEPGTYDYAIHLARDSAYFYDPVDKLEGRISVK